MTDSEQKETRRGRAAAESPTQQDAPPPEEPQGPAEDELPLERLLSDEAEALVSAPAHEVAGALALAGVEGENLKTEDVEQALAAYRSYVPNDSTHPPEEA